MHSGTTRKPYVAHNSHGRTAARTAATRALPFNSLRTQERALGTGLPAGSSALPRAWCVLLGSFGSAASLRAQLAAALRPRLSLANCRAQQDKTRISVCAAPFSCNKHQQISPLGSCRNTHCNTCHLSEPQQKSQHTLLAFVLGSFVAVPSEVRLRLMHPVVVLTISWQVRALPQDSCRLMTLPAPAAEWAGQHRGQQGA